MKTSNTEVMSQWRGLLSESAKRRFPLYSEGNSVSFGLHPYLVQTKQFEERTTFNCLITTVF